MDNIHIGRYGHQSTEKPPSPRLLRSRSGAPAISLLETRAFAVSPSQRRVNNNRSISATKSRINSADEHQLNPFSRGSAKKQYLEKKKDGCGFDEAKKMRRTVLTSPSAWALSPGRSPKIEPQPQPPKPKMGAAVFNYFRLQKKVCPIRKEEFHKFRVLHNTLVQWRWANARADFTMTATNIVAEEKMFNVWVRMLKRRKSIVEERIELQRVKHEMKLLRIVKPEMMSLLNEWAKIEKKNCEAVEKLATKLWALATKLPLREGAKGDVMGVYNAMRTAVGVMESIEKMLSTFFSQADKRVDLFQQLITILQQHNKWSHEVHQSIPIFASLLARELSLRAHVIQERELFTITKYQRVSCFS